LGLVLYAQDGNWATSQQLVVGFAADDEWQTLALPIVADDGSAFDASAIKALVVGIYSSDPPATVDGGTVPAFVPAAVTVHVDSIVLQ
jgi:hypothetical protein